MHDFVKKVSREPFFAKIIAVNDTRFAHFDIAAKWVFIETRGIQPQMRFTQLESLFKDHRTFSEKSEAARLVVAALTYLRRALPQKCAWLRNRANVLSVCMLAAAVVRNKLDKTSADSFGTFIGSFFQQLAKEVEKGASSRERELLEYQQAISYGSTGGDSIRKRLSILTRHLATSDPAFAPLLKGPSVQSDGGTTTAIEGDADAIRKLIYAANQKYAAVHGEDLFKATNETTDALLRLRAPITDAQSYGLLIDALYKLIYEGSGNCSRLSSPPPDFSMDVKHLRTGIRHDVDHGDTKKSAAKRKLIGSVLEKYSAKKSPEECTAEDFAVIQIKLLKGAREMLLAL